MIFEAIGGVFINMFSGLIDLLPSIEAQLPTGIIGMLSNIVTGIAYFLPADLFGVLIILSFSLDFGTVFWRVLMRIKSFIPTMGN